MMLRLLEEATGLSALELLSIIKTASRRYKSYTIAKRTGGRRPISHPSPEVKFLQKWLVDNVFSLLPVHSGVKSYRKNTSIADNAGVHVKANYLLKMDFQDFFISITALDIKKLIEENADRLIKLDLSAQDIANIISIVCKDGRLTIGAPSSPILSNAILYRFDSKIEDICRSRGISYSRYADDIAFSTNEPNRLELLIDDVKTILAEIKSPIITINEKKTVLSSRKHRRKITGVVLTSERKLSIGRAKKREIRSLVFKYTQKELTGEQVSYLRGYLSYVRSVEPAFIDRIVRKYGEKNIVDLMKEPLVSRKTQ